MKNISLFALFIIFGCLICGAKEKVDTLWTTDKDRIILTYEIEYKENSVDVCFNDLRNRLGRRNADKYTKTEDVKVILFDKIGVYDNVRFLDMIPKTFVVPANLRYSYSEDGYLILDNNELPQTISFQIEEKEYTKLRIPLYIANYEEKGEYTLFSVCEQLEIDLFTDKAKLPSLPSADVVDTLTITIEDEDNADVVEVLSSIKTIKELLPKAKRLPFEGFLAEKIYIINDRKHKITDKDIKEKIDDVIIECEKRKAELEQEAEEKVAIEKREAEEKAAEEKAKNDSIATAERIEQEQKAEADKKRNMWLIIGGILFAGLCFVGNQVLQHFRNIQNQRSMLEMQQNIAQRAEYEAKRHAQNFARKKTNEMVNKVKRNGQETKSRNASPKRNSNNNKRFSI